MELDWHDDPAWDLSAQVDFRKRISRARGQKFFYLGRKASAIAPHQLAAALDLCAERFDVAEDEDERHGALTQKAMILAAAGRVDDMLDVMNEAIGEDITYRSVLAGEFCCLVAYFNRAVFIDRANDILKSLDEWAVREAGRPFHSFTTQAARALLDHNAGARSDAVKHAKTALKLALDRSATLAALSRGQNTGGFPSLLNDKLLVISGLWDEEELGSPPSNQPFSLMASENYDDC